MKRFLLIAAIALAAGAQTFDLSIDNIMRGPGLTGYNQDDVRWSPEPSASATNRIASAIASKAASCALASRWNLSPKASHRAPCNCRRTAIRSC